MDSTPEKTGAPERRVSTRNSVRLSVHDADDDGDMMAMSMVTDGFRPAQFGQGAMPPQSTPSLASTSTTILGEESPDSARKARPSSVSKAHRPHDSLTLRREGGMGQIPEPEGLTRQLSGSTDSTAYLPSERSYQGPSGPSHPYQMYPQNVRMARTMSTTTASTIPVSESSYAGPRGPSHPYGLYHQSDGTETGTTQDPAIPLGFHGLPDQYQRRLGPDGEDAADLIGPDGHTEQLPPYTRYPDETYVRKIAAVEGDSNHAPQQETTTASPPAQSTVIAPTVPPVVTQSPSLTPALPGGAGGLGLATRNPEFDSTDDLGSPQSRHSSRSFTSDSTQSQNAYKPFVDGAAEKQKPLKPWQIWMRRKLCGIIPYWVLCTIGLLLLLMGFILGAVIGTFVLKQKNSRKAWSPNGPPSPTATFGAIPIPTPPDLQPLPTGTFSMALMTSRESKTCFQDTTLSTAWACFFVMGPHLTIAQADAGYTASLTTNESLTVSNHVYSYGEQPPWFEKPFTLGLVNDTFELTRGPAWYKLLQYDKTVVIYESLLNASTTPTVSRKMVRNLGGFGDLKRKNVAQPGDKPWVCTWPDVYLELFIYPQQNTSLNGFPPGGIGGGGGPGNGMGGKPSQGFGPFPTQPPSESSVNPEATYSTPPTAPPSSQPTRSAEPLPSSTPPDFQANPQQNSQQNSQRNPPQDRQPQPQQNPGPGRPGTPTESSTPSGTPRFGTIDTGDGYGPPPPFFPRVMKLGERRIYTPGRRQPECRQIEIQGPGVEPKPVLDSNNNPVVIKILEIEPSPHGPGPVTGPSGPISDSSETSSSNTSKRSDSSLGWEEESRLFSREAYTDMSPCGCMWWRI
ncbi:hypothetical protein QBC38DRAFT_359836 [Podospora fimiseda]|uniref:DUF7820 domain-containing protein n=1 Tax=Podospora fimiseda TaxID=252190 RepID=A0AAN7BTS1_9PEZI|nr:hypothetical protein QBC38DRAFT_359836 [Podospora fimiseda]